ncbi:2,3-dihydro-2,3-dihydroxybenzoate dehydrogenase [Paenibacillus chitinolyticus]|uniref:2,3-dihydro-2,3-dihydroxybenzoate dehydrogenase n=1 Tax=Paenibacillus chitinolyticus TaxID=79263 RepID=UPI003D07A9D1
MTESPFARAPFTGISGKVAVVTGAAQGIGETAAAVLGSLGAVIAAVDRQGDKAARTAEALASSGVSAAAYTTDVADSSAVEEVVGRIEREQGPVDILVHAAGVLQYGTGVTLGDEEWERTFAVNTTGAFYVCRSVISRMSKRRRGSIVLIGSNAGTVPRYGMSAYAASKAAAAMMLKCLGLEHAAEGIRCNIVSPGSTDTPMQRGMWEDESGEFKTISGSPELYKLGIPLGKLATPEDIAWAAAFLSSDQAGHITLHDIRIDGGATLGR